WSRYLPSPPAPVGWAATITFFVTTLVFFRSPNLGYAFNYLDTMLSFRGGWPAVVDDAAPPWEVVAGGGGVIVPAWVEVRFATAGRSSRHAPSRGAGQPRIPVGRRAATDPDPGDQCEPIHLFSVLDSPPCLSPHCPRGSLV